MNSIWPLLKCSRTICPFPLFPPFCGNICVDKLLRLTGSFHLLYAPVFAIRAADRGHLKGAARSSPRPEHCCSASFHVSRCENRFFFFSPLRKIPMFCLITFCYGFPPRFSENFLSLPRLLFNRDDIVLALLAICSCTAASFNSPVGC